MVPFFWPGIGEENMHPFQRIYGDHFLKNSSRVMLDYPYIRKGVPLYFPQEASYPRFMDFKPNVVFSGIFSRDNGSRPAHAKPDFGNDRIAVSKNPDKIQYLVFAGNYKLS
jgi:hypothetical protein